MAKMLQLSRPSKGVSNVVRAWLVARQQRRRRRALAASTGTPPAPVIVNGWCEASQTMEGTFDLVFDFTFDDAGLPVATFEVWGQTGGRQAQRVAVIASTERNMMWEETNAKLPGLLRAQPRQQSKGDVASALHCTAADKCQIRDAELAQINSAHFCDRALQSIHEKILRKHGWRIPRSGNHGNSTFSPAGRVRNGRISHAPKSLAGDKDPPQEKLHYGTDCNICRSTSERTVASTRIETDQGKPNEVAACATTPGTPEKGCRGLPMAQHQIAAQWLRRQSPGAANASLSGRGRGGSSESEGNASL